LARLKIFIDIDRDPNRSKMLTQRLDDADVCDPFPCLGYEFVDSGPENSIARVSRPCRNVSPGSGTSATSGHSSVSSHVGAASHFEPLRVHVSLLRVDAVDGVPLRCPTVVGGGSSRLSEY
jgi:hypothetical protein